MFGQDGNFEEALKNSIAASIKERIETACETWDLKAVLAVAWGVKEKFDPSQADALSAFLDGAADTEFDVSSGETVKFLKGGVKVKGDDATLIYRYQIIKDNL